MAGAGQGFKCSSICVVLSAKVVRALGPAVVLAVLPVVVAAASGAFASTKPLPAC